MNEWFVINDLDEFAEKTRTIVYNNFGNSEEESSEIDFMIDELAEDSKADLDRVLSHSESLLIIKNIVKKQVNKKTKDHRFILNDSLFAEIIQSLNDRMVSNILQGLVSKGLVESSYDSELNDFVFWVKDQNEEQKENPETD